MAVREHFNDEMSELKKSIIDLANGTKEALNRAILALNTEDVNLANQIILDDKLLDDKELEINEETILLIAKQQPVATDLRRLIVALRISSDLERMADNAKNIAKSTIHLGEGHGLVIHPLLDQMKKKATEMIDLSITAFEYEDITLARKLGEMDDVIDNMYGELVKELLEETANNPQKIQHIMQMAFSGRYIERFGDHITNIGESILYLVKGESLDLNK
ncbi:phosphate signaling complex protein PhoU [Sediminibacillus massiliensis]|uniref:phosphate signaling complex protein PhoU n=1 Tax=Sediminibacillus massiliensis TaxID=1926277 RepID=UPI00098880B2|nr:phosphate signaling complex protein PhoU [Sediminibacillus massiliensis]